MLNSGMSWLPGSVSQRCTPSESQNRRAAANCAARARCVMSPLSTTASGFWSRANTCKAATTGGSSVPKWVSEMCSRTVIAASLAAALAAPCRTVPRRLLAKLDGPGNRDRHGAAARLHRHRRRRRGRAHVLRGHAHSRHEPRLARVHGDLAQRIAGKAERLGQLAGLGLEALDGLRLRIRLDPRALLPAQAEAHAAQGHALDAARGLRDAAEVAPFEHEFGRAGPAADAPVTTVAGIEGEVAGAHVHL